MLRVSKIIYFSVFKALCSLKIYLIRGNLFRVYASSILDSRDICGLKRTRFRYNEVEVQNQG